MQERTAVVDDIPMRWIEHGDGHPVVFVHGIPTSAELWRHVLPRLDSARCLAWEMPGYGASIPAGTDRDLSVARQADYLVAWLDHLSIDRAVFAGHDLGGGVIQILAARHHHRVAGLVLTNAICYDSWPIPSVQAMQRAAPVLRCLPDSAIYPCSSPSCGVATTTPPAPASRSVCTGGTTPPTVRPVPWSGRSTRSTRATHSRSPTNCLSWMCPLGWSGAPPTGSRRSTTAPVWPVT